MGYSASTSEEELCKAAKEGNLDKAREALNKGADVTFEEKIGAMHTEGRCGMD